MKVQGCPGTGSIQYITVWVVYITFVCTGEQYTKVHTHTYGIRYRTQILSTFLKKWKTENLKNEKSSWCAWASAPAHCSWVTAGRQSFSCASQQYQASERLPLLKASRTGYCSCLVQSCLGKRDRVGIGRRSRHVDLVCVLGSFREAWIVPRKPPLFTFTGMGPRYSSSSQ